MQNERTILDILSDNFCDLTGQISRDIEAQNKVYKEIMARIDIILNCYPRIAKIEYADSAQTFELAELKAIHELNTLKDVKRAYEEQEYYITGIRDCFQFVVPLLEIDIKKIEEIIKCR